MKPFSTTVLLALLASAPVSAGAASLPAGLVGGWDYGSVSLAGTYNPATNVWRSGLGAGASLDLAEDGRYTYTQRLESNFGACTMEVFTWHRGRAEVRGDLLTLTPDDSRVRVENSCGDGPSERRGTVGPRTNRFALAPSRASLTLADPQSGAGLTYQKRASAP